MSVPKWQSLKHAADRARKGADHGNAIELYIKALALPDVPWEATVDMTIASAYCRKMIGQFSLADTSLSALAEKAAQRGDDATIVKVYSELLVILRKSGNLKRGLQLEQDVLNAAERVGDPNLKAEALLSLGLVKVELGEVQAVQALLTEALDLIQPEEKFTQLKAYFLKGILLNYLGQYQDLIPNISEALEIARSIGDHDWEGIALNGLAASYTDMTLKRVYFEQALEAFEIAGDQTYQAVVIANSCDVWNNVGLYKRAFELAQRALDMSRETEQDALMIYCFQNLGGAADGMGDLLAAINFYNEGIILAKKIGLVHMEHILFTYLGSSHLLLEQMEQAYAAFKSADLLPYKHNKASQINFLALRAGADALSGNQQTARRDAQQAMKLLDEIIDIVTQDVSVAVICWWCYYALLPTSKITKPDKKISKQAWHALELGIKGLLIPIENLSDAGLKRGYLHRNIYRRLLITEWLKYIPLHNECKENVATFTAQVQKPGRLDEVFQRLLKVGVRLNAERDPVALPDEILEEVDELTGAERIVLILLDEVGKRRLVKTLLPRPPFPAMIGKEDARLDPGVFIAEIEPWLEEAIETRQGFIRHLNPEAGLTEQRSLLVTPLISQGKLMGVIYCDLTGCFGRFDLEDLNLLGVLANQSAVAVKNADWSSTLEQKVDQRTVELKQSNDRLEQRNAELAIINSVQAALAAELSIQGIYDAVGDKIREIFHTGNVDIRVYDPQTNILHFPYEYEEGVRITKEPEQFTGKGFQGHVIRTHETLVINENMPEAIEKYGSYVWPGTLSDKSSVYVPMVVGDQARGLVCLSDYEKEHAFSDSDVRLLETLVNSMSIALENARLFDETQRLFKAEQDRVAELEIINSVQQGLAAELDFQAIIDLVGDKLREVLDIGDLGIRWYDEKANLLHYLYSYEHGKRLYIEPMIPTPGGIFEQVFTSRLPLIGKTAADINEYAETIPGTDPCKSNITVPVISSDKVLGIITCENYEREYAYGEAEQRLLTTIAASLGTALENARLFDETQRLFKAEQDRVAELEIINSIQKGLGAELDFQAIIDLVGDKLRGVFKTPDLIIAWYDEKTGLMHQMYVYEHDQRLTIPPGKPRSEGPFMRMTRTHQPVIWNTAEEGDILTGGVIPGTDRSNSGVMIPIISSDRVLGIVQLENYEIEHAFGESELRLLTTIAASLGSALENARLFDETQRLLKETEQRNAELAIINSVQAALAVELNIQGIYDAVGDKIREIFHSDNLEIRIFDPKTNQELFPYLYEKGERIEQEPLLRIDKGIAAHVARTRETLVINENLIQEAEKFGSYVMPGTHGALSAVFVPLIVGDQVRGLVGLSDFEHENSFSDSDVRLLQTLVNSMSVALENARLFNESQRLLEETSQRASELAIINSVSQAMSSQLQVDAIVRTVGDQVRDSLHSEVVNIYLYDPNSQMIHLPYSYDRKIVVTEPFPYGSGLTSKVINTKQPLILGSFEEITREGALLSPNAPDDALMPQSYLGVPIIVSEKAIGVIDVQSYKQCVYGDSHVRLLSTLASSMGVALENARLFEETQRLLKETEQRNAELAIINSVQAALASELNIQGIYDVVGDKIREIFHNDSISIRIYDPLTTLLHYPYLYEDGKRITLESEPFDLLGFSGHVLRTRETLVINENMAQAVEKYGSIVYPGTKYDKSAVYVPLIAGTQARGLVSMSNFEREHAFSDSDVRLLQTLVNSMSVALENARLFDETQRLLKETEQRNRELAIISRIGQALAGLLDPQGIYELVGEELRLVFDAQVVAIITYDRQENLVHWRYSIEKGERQSVAPHPPGGFSGHILHTREPLLITHDVALRAEEFGSSVLVGELSKSYLGVPLIAGGEVTGVITLQNIDREDAFSENDLRLLSTLALSMGVALENARLYQETQHHAVEMAALAEIGSDIASTHEMEPVLERMATKTRELMQVRDIALYLLQPDGHTLKPLVSQGKYAEETKAQMISLGFGITGSIAQTGVAEIVNNPERDPRALHIKGTPFEEEDLECIMLAPLISRGHVIGVMSVYRDRDQGLFTQLELDFLVSLARQAAIAIESARLYAETERRATEMAALAEVSREISATLELQVVLERITGQARELLAAGNSAVFLLQPDGKTIKAIAAEGDIAKEVLADEVILGIGIIGSIVKSGVAEWIDDTAKDARGVQIPGTQEINEGEKLLVAPLLIQKRAIGALAVWRNPDDPTFNQAELSFAIGLAQQAVVAIENARLFEAAQESQRRMADIIDFLPDATFVVDREGNVIAWNHAIEEMTGVRAADILGKGNYEYSLPFYGERRPILIDAVLVPNEEIEAKYDHFQRHGNVFVGEAISVVKEKTMYLNATASALKNSKGEAVGAIESIRDITDQKRAEQELHLAKAEAEAANQAKSAFLAMMSHEIRTPMNAIIGMSGLLMDTQLNPDQREFAETIRSSGDTLLTIINDILDFSKIEAGKMTLEEVPFDLRECIEASLELIKVKASEKNLELAYQIDSGVPPAIIGDVTRLRQVLINLLGNSVKFTEQGEIVLTVSQGEMKSSLHFSVRDTGIGIPVDRISQLFRPFTQADASTSRRYGGTGLGLALSSRLVDLMGGRMWVESEGVPGKGSTFHFIIFAKPAKDWKGRPHMEGEHPQLRGRRVLVVDDNATNRRILQLQTEAWGMLSRESASPWEALEILRQGERFDLAILDMHMPDMSGMELANEIRKLEASQPGISRTPLVLSTSLGGREEARESTEFATILLKPIRQSALFDMLMTLFAGHVEITGKPAAERFTLDPEMASRHPLRILLAEDNVVNQKLALRLLSQMGYRADVAANGLEVLQAVIRQPYDVILMDVQMPEMDGLEATRRLCADISSGKRPRIIAMTANAMQGDREMCLEAGMDDYLCKPIRVDELVTALSLARTLTNE